MAYRIVIALLFLKEEPRKKQKKRLMQTFKHMTHETVAFPNMHQCVFKRTYSSTKDL